MREPQHRAADLTSNQKYWHSGQTKKCPAIMDRAKWIKSNAWIYKAAGLPQAFSASRKEKTNTRWDHNGAAHWAAVDCRWPAPPRHPRFSHPDDRALGEGGAMTDETTIAEWIINNRRERVRVSIEQFKGVHLVNVRKWFEAEDGSLRPGKAGIALNVKHLPQLTEAVIKALSVASERELIAGPEPSPSGSEG
jgi:hypothetical protein